jgi:hypothetical protein
VEVKCFIISYTHSFFQVQLGFDYMIVVAVGMHTQFGIIKELKLKTVPERLSTPLQESLEVVATGIYR